MLELKSSEETGCLEPVFKKNTDDDNSSIVDFRYLTELFIT